MESVGVNASRKYVVHIGAGLLREIPSVWTPVYNMCKLLVVTDDTVDKLYADSVFTAVNERGFEAKKICYSARGRLVRNHNGSAKGLEGVFRWKLN